VYKRSPFVYWSFLVVCSSSMRKNELKMVEFINIFILGLVLEYLALATNYARKELVVKI